MRIQLVRTLQGGEKLAGPVITKENEILISEGTTLKTEYLDLISFLGIETVCIEDPYEEDETPHDIISNEKREEYIEKIKSILEKHIYHRGSSLREIEYVAEDIIQDVMQADENMVIDLLEREGNLYEHTLVVTKLCIIVAKKRSSLRSRFTDLHWEHCCMIWDSATLRCRISTATSTNCQKQRLLNTGSIRSLRTLFWRKKNGWILL